MSKKLIAVASATALALSALVAMPTVATASLGAFAVSTVQSETLSRVDTNGSTGDLELQIAVPSSDTVRYVAGTTNAFVQTTSNTLLRFNVQTSLAGTAVIATASAGAKLVSQTQVTAGSLTTASGTSTLSVSSDSAGVVAIYAYATSTADQTITIAAGSNSTSLFIKGVSANANAYKINFTGPTTVAIGGAMSFSGTVVDMFGNLLTLTDAEITTTQLGGSLTAGPITETLFAVNATTQVTTFDIVASTTESAQAIGVALTTPAAEITALGSRVTSKFFSVNATDLTTVVAALTAQVAALTADYNALATRWNKKVDSKRRVFNKVALK